MRKKVLGVIPARLHSTRLPRKLLADIGGQPLIFYTWRQAKQARLLDEVIITTDSSEIQRAAEAFGARVMMTSSKHKTGTDRVAEAAARFADFLPEIVVNIQGDEPLIPPQAIDLTASLLVADRRAVMSTVATSLTSKEELASPAIVKVVLDQDGFALYFSRSVIPYPRHPHRRYFKHLGLYGYRRQFLTTFAQLPQTPLERTESLEQLRALEYGYRIKVGVGTFRRIEVNEKHELEAVRHLLVRSYSSKNDENEKP